MYSSEAEIVSKCDFCNFINLNAPDTNLFQIIIPCTSFHIHCTKNMYELKFLSYDITKSLSSTQWEKEISLLDYSNILFLR
jgi:hypothetical protein